MSLFGKHIGWFSWIKKQGIYLTNSMANEPHEAHGLAEKVVTLRIGKLDHFFSCTGMIEYAIGKKYI